MDDWGADFKDNIVFVQTPKMGGLGSIWGRGRAQEALEEVDEDSDDDSCKAEAAFDPTVRSEAAVTGAEATTSCRFIVWRTTTVPCCALHTTAVRRKKYLLQFGP